MARDGDLRSIFRRRLPRFHWNSIETAGTGRGIPDAEFCYNGKTAWIEFKVTMAWSVDLRAEQVAWLMRRARAGGRCWVAVRRQSPGGPRKGLPADELWLVSGDNAAALKREGLKCGSLTRVWVHEGGPARWDWDKIGKVLLS